MPGENNHGKKSSVLVHEGDLFDVVKPRTQTYTTVLKALDRLYATGPPPPHAQSYPHAR
jgi:DNA repair exonuclease SbcCD nuclease subunit